MTADGVKIEIKSQMGIEMSSPERWLEVRNEKGELLYMTNGTTSISLSPIFK